jgi:hypothetical protein
MTELKNSVETFNSWLNHVEERTTKCRLFEIIHFLGEQKEMNEKQWRKHMGLTNTIK